MVYVNGLTKLFVVERLTSGQLLAFFGPELPIYFNFYLEIAEKNKVKKWRNKSMEIADLADQTYHLLDMIQLESEIDLLELFVLERLCGATTNTF